MANALSKYYDNITDCITTPVTIQNPFTNTEVQKVGIWDTGATSSVITKKTAADLGLIPISKAYVRGISGQNEVNVYAVKITLNNDQITLTDYVTECEELSSDNSVGMLIGMNIITKGDLSITNFDGHTVMTFIHPSQKSIDYVAEIREYNKMKKIHENWIRTGNEKCPCGSGKLYKNCHGKIKYT